MKTTYKLIKEYPGSPCKGTERTVDTYNGRVVTSNTSGMYDVYPEFWEEVTPEYIKITQSEYWPRTIEMNNGNLIFHKDFISFNKISREEEFKLDCRHLPMILESSTKEEYDAQFRKPLFTTEDGVDIKWGDFYHAYNPKTENCWIATCNEGTQISKGVLTFSTSENRNEYITKHKILFTTFDGVGMKEKDIYYWVDEDYDLETGEVSSSSGRCPENKYFASKEKAEEFIKLHIPKYSETDIYALQESGIYLYCSTAYLVNRLNELK